LDAGYGDFVWSCLAQVAELAHPIEGAELVLTVYVSDNHAGAVLQQRVGRQGSLLRLGFFSKKLNTAQQTYSAFDREWLAAVLAIWHFWLGVEGQQFCDMKDHKPLTQAVHHLSDAWTSLQQRHLSNMVEYMSDIRHMAGQENVVAEALSCYRYTAASVLPVEGGKLTTSDLATAQLACTEAKSMWP